MTLYLPVVTLYIKTWHYISKYEFVMGNTYFLVPKNTAVSHYHMLLYLPLTCVLKRSVWCVNRPSNGLCEVLSLNYQTLHDPCMQTVNRLKATVYPGMSFSVGVVRNIWAFNEEIETHSQGLVGSVSCRSPWWLAEVRFIVWKQTLTFNSPRVRKREAKRQECFFSGVAQIYKKVFSIIDQKQKSNM